MSKNIDEKDLVRRLGGLGLTEKESRVYLALLPYRDIGSSKLIRATGLHGQFVYDALKKLEGLGLARHVIQNGRKKFSAQTPARLLSILEEKKLAAQSIAKELQSRFAGKYDQNFEVYQGDEAFIAHQMDILRSVPYGTTWTAIASEADRYRDVFEAYGMAEELARREKNWLDWTYKILPGLGVGIIGIEIFPEAVSFVTYGESILCFTLRSKEVANGYRDFFDSLWNLSGK